MILYYLSLVVFTFAWMTFHQIWSGQESVEMEEECGREDKEGSKLPFKILSGDKDPCLLGGFEANSKSMK